MALDSVVVFGRSVSQRQQRRRWWRRQDFVSLLTLRNSSRKQHTVGVRVFARCCVCVSREHDVTLCVGSFLFIQVLLFSHSLRVCVCVYCLGWLLVDARQRPSDTGETNKRAQEGKRGWEGGRKAGERERESLAFFSRRRQTDSRGPSPSRLVVLSFYTRI